MGLGEYFSKFVKMELEVINSEEEKDYADVQKAALSEVWDEQTLSDYLNHYYDPSVVVAKVLAPILEK